MREGANRYDEFPKPFGKESDHANALCSPHHFIAKRPYGSPCFGTGPFHPAIARLTRPDYLEGCRCGHPPTNMHIGRQMGCSNCMVGKWRRRYHDHGLAGLHDAPRTGRRHAFTPLARAQIIAPACGPPLEHGKPWVRWSDDKLATVAVAQQIVPSLSEEVNLRRAAGEALIERFESDALTADDRCLLAKLITLHFSQILEDAPERETTLISTAGVAQSKRVKHKKAMRSEAVRPATKAFIEILHHRPNVYGINRSNWSYPSLADAYEKQYSQRMSTATVRRLLQEAGYRWKKSRKVLTSPDPRYREKVELVLRTLQSLQVDELFFFIDELGPLQVRRYGGRCYTPKGEMPTHPQIQRSKGSITLYGALSATTNQVNMVLWGDERHHRHD